MRYAISTLLATLAAGTALAVDLPVAADVHVGPGTVPTGTLPNLSVGAGNRSMLRFEMTPLPSGLSPSQVVKATLVFHVNRVAAAGPIRLSMLAGPFQELTATQATAPPAGTALVQLNPVQGLNLADVTPLVQQWVTSPASAFGIDIAADPSGSASILIDSRENTATSFAAEIRVVLSGPAGAIGPMGPPGPQGPQGPAGGVSPSLQTAVCELYRTTNKSLPPGFSCPTKLAFVTSSFRTANLGGLAGADVICNNEAAAAGRGGTFKAWLSTASLAASQRLNQFTVPLIRADGVLVAYNWAEFTSGTLRAPINLTASGGAISNPGPFSAWTNTSASGGFAGGLDCSGWTASGPAAFGAAGMITETDSRWTNSVTGSCSAQLRLYCVEQ